MQNGCTAGRTVFGIQSTCNDPQRGPEINMIQIKSIDYGEVGPDNDPRIKETKNFNIGPTKV